MAHEHSHETGHTAPVAPFSAAELNTFHASDRKEIGIIIAMIAAIFTIGVVIYTTVATIVAESPNYPAVVATQQPHH